MKHKETQFGQSGPLLAAWFLSGAMAKIVAEALFYNEFWWRVCLA